MQPLKPWPPRGGEPHNVAGALSWMNAVNDQIGHRPSDWGNYRDSYTHTQRQVFLALANEAVRRDPDLGKKTIAIA